ncbi:hypothetical protein K3495_g6419 [Podosphaera aphanis]|nr:hypothetical protein K3495_g6419 [Podosphaera aphanis]
MKICILYSFEDGINSLCTKYTDIPDPRRYIPETSHQFFIRYVTKANSKRDIDSICKEGKKAGWEMYLNLMWGIALENVAGFAATRYMESKGVTILTNPSKFLKKTKLELYDIATKVGLPIPLDTNLVYPKIVKYGNAYGSLNLDNDSICYSDEAVIQRVSFMERSCPQFKVLVQDYIAGREIAVTVFEVGGKQIAATPVECIFPKGLTPNESFLTWEMKFDERDHGNILEYALMEEEPAQSNVKNAALKAFKSYNIAGSAGWARINMRLGRSTGKVFIIEINSIPQIFYPSDKLSSDDLAVYRLPGGHAAFFDTLLTTKQSQMRIKAPKYKRLAAMFNASATDYQAWLFQSDVFYFKLMSFFIYKYDFTGSVFDVACGGGIFGKLLHNHGIKAAVNGLDISEKMSQPAAIDGHYDTPVLLGPMQELIMEIGMQDHIVCFGALHFLDRVEFNAVLVQIFLLARKSVTFEVDDLDDHHINDFTSPNRELCFSSNNIQASRLFGIPEGWEKVCDMKYPIYTSMYTGREIMGIWYRFEKI